MQAYENEDYELALEYANKHGYAGPFTYVYFTSTYGQLNQVENARTSLDKLLQSKPTIATTIRKDCRFWNYPEPVIAKIVDGLRKAGLDVPDEPATTD